MKHILLLFFSLIHVSHLLLLKKETIHVLIGRDVFLKPGDLVFENSTIDAVCKVEVINNEPMTQQVGILIPQVFDCAFLPRTVKYVHHGSPLLANDTVKLRAYNLLKQDTISEYFELIVLVENSSYDIIQPVSPLIIKEFFGLTEQIDDSVIKFNYSQKEGAVCKVRMSRHISLRPAHGQVVVGKERRSVNVIKRKCEDFLQLGLRYEHLKPPSPNIDFILIIVEVNDPYLNDGDLISEWYQIPVLIEPGFPNLPPKASFSGMYLMDVDQFIITAITPAVLSATDSETPSDQLVFNISKPLLAHQGSIVHLSDHTRPIHSFKQSDLNNFDIAYKPPARSFKDRQMFEIGFIIRDPDFAYSEPFSMHIAIRPAITTAPRVSMNVGLVLLEGQSRPLRKSNLEIVDSDNIKDIQIFVTGGLHHGRLEVDGRAAVSFTQQNVISESVVYHHDDSDSVRDSIHLRIHDGFHSTHVKFPITIIPKDDNYPSLVINVGLKVREGSEVQITPSLLKAVDQDTTDEHVKFLITKLPISGRILKKLAWEKSGSAVTEFSQLDLNKGLIYYHHDGNEVFTDLFEIVLQDASNPPNESPPYKVFIRIISVGDDPPKRDPASSFSLEVQETEIGLFNSQNLHFMDIDSHVGEIIYSVTTAPRFIGSFAHADPGKIVILGNQVVFSTSYSNYNLTPVFSFTQEQVNHHKVAYLPPVDEIGPNPLYLQFVFSVKDKDNNIVAGQIFNITILPVNNQVPQIHTGELLVEEGSSTLLSTNELSVYDPDTLSSDLQMSLFTVPLFGSLRRSEQPLRVGDLLSLDDILTLRLEYNHDGSENFKDAFKVGVNDGVHFVSGDVSVSIDPVDDEQPVWKKDLLPRISVPESGMVKLTSEILAASDVDTEDSSIFFILTEQPLLGSLFLGKLKVNRFTQNDILNGEVFYVHHSQEIGPNPKEDSLTFIVTDKAFPRSTTHNSHRVFITILPKNTQPPRLYFKRAILVDEGQRSVITEDNLSATDEDTFPAELLIVITKQPDYGYIENSRPTPGYENSKSKKINAFPLQDVKDGFITFVQHIHRAIEPESDDFEVFVTDGVHNSTSVLVFISIVLLNDEVPTFLLSNITVNEGDSHALNNNTITASDRDFPGDILVLSVKTKPSHGSLSHFLQAVNNGPLLEIPFNQLSIEKFDKIVYRHDGSENFVDFFTLSLNDGLHSVLRTCFVEILPVNDEPPILKKNIVARNVELQSSFILSSATLLSEDEDTSPSELLYKLTKTVSYGNLEKKNGSNWNPLDSLEFTQEDVDLNLIRYRQVSKPSPLYEDEFHFVLTDGVHISSPSTFKLKLVDFGKSKLNVINKSITINYGNSKVINSSFLFAFDNSSRIEDIQFIVIKPPSFGILMLHNNLSEIVKNFTISNIINNEITYKHNTTFKVNKDSFDLMVTNTVIVKNITFHVIILNSYKEPILEQLSPLYVHDFNPHTLTSEHLFSQSSISGQKIKYIITEEPKYGSLIFRKNDSRIKSFSQEDVDLELISYQLDFETAENDQFLFQVTYSDKSFMQETLSSFVFPIVIKIAEETPTVFISSPINLEKVWNQHLGFSINSYNLKAEYSNIMAKDIYFNVVKYLDYGYIFHQKENKVVRTFSQEDINEQLIIVIIKNQPNSQDYFTFNIVLNGSIFDKEYRMDFQWSVVYFPYAEYSVCEDAGSLNIIIQRSGNVNVSSYVTISAIEQTAKEGLDFVSRRVSKIQFDPGTVEILWKIVVVKDDLDEAPIEQMQVVLSEPENCLIYDHNRTIVSIYDFNRGSCSQIPVMGPQDRKVDLNNLDKFEGNNLSEEGNNDQDFDFPRDCTQNIYGLLHFEQSSQNLFQCDGEKWIPWTPSVTKSAMDFEISSSPIDLNTKSTPIDIDIDSRSEDLGVFSTVTGVDDLTTRNLELNNMNFERAEESTILPINFKSTVPTPEIERCWRGWQEFAGKCHKWNRPSTAWDNAQETCKSYPSGNLVVVESLEHSNWLMQLARGKPFWIGLHASSDSNEWGYFRPNDAPFFNWKKGFPRLPATGDMKHRCVLARGSGLWINKNCDGHEHSFICIMPLYMPFGSMTI